MVEAAAAVVVVVVVVIVVVAAVVNITGLLVRLCNIFAQRQL